MSTPSKGYYLVTSIARAELARLCQVFGASLQTDLAGTNDGSGAPIDGPGLLWALAGRESRYGDDLGPRHEPAYDVNGYYWRKFDWCQRGVAMWSRDFACSYGPLQIMACNAHGHTPKELGSNPEAAMGAAVAFLRIEILGRQKARTIDAICDAWNTGNARDKNVPHEYIAFVRNAYFTQVISPPPDVDGEISV